MKNNYKIIEKTWSQVVTEYNVYIKNSSLWLGKFRTLKQAIHTAETPYINYPKGDRVIFKNKPHWL